MKNNLLAEKNSPHEQAKALPHNPGVYLMKNKENTIIYVGKAKDLRKRVTSYFLAKRDRKTTALVKKIAKIEFIITGNNYEALVLENNLIKKYSPHYNIMLKDGKSYPMIRITKEEYPKVFITRRILNDGSQYFGPFPEVGQISIYMDLINKMFNLRKCGVPLKKRKIPCLYYHIGRCDAPCCGKANPIKYAKNVDKVKSFLSGKVEPLKKELEKEMYAASQKMEYEIAATKRDLIKAVDSVSQQQVVEDYSCLESRDYAAIVMRSPICTIALMQFRDGKLIGRALYRAQTFGDETETLLNFLIQYYEDGRQLPKEVYVSHEIDVELISQFFKDQLKENAPIILVPKDGKHFRILRMANENALRDVEKRLRKNDNTVGLERLKEILGLEESPSLIEGFDIAQLSGKYTVASLITFVDGNPFNSGYRRFNIKSLNGKIDDYGAIAEAVQRRYSRVINEKQKKPNIILIDGGIGQVNTAREVLDEVGLADVPVIGLAKEEETIVFDNGREPLKLYHSDEGLRILIAVRDECHRFATNANQAMRSKEASFRLLKTVPGVGEQTAKKLMEEFISIDKIIDSTPEEISSKCKISQKKAESILKSLNL